MQGLPARQDTDPAPPGHVPAPPGHVPAAASSLAERLACLPGGATALHHGRVRLSRSDLLTRGQAHHSCPPTASARAVAITTPDPLKALSGVLQAQSTRAVPLLCGPQHPQGGIPALLDAAGHLDPATGPWLALLTSGSSNAPRAVLRTCRSWNTSLDPFTTVCGITPDDLVWAPGDLSSTLTFFATWHALATGVPVLLSGRWRGAAAAGPATRAVTLVHAVPHIVEHVLTAHARGALPRLRTVITAGSCPSPTLRRRTQDAGIHLVEYYGAAELSLVAVDPDGHGLRPFPGVELTVRDGLVWARSPYLCDGYLAPCPGPLRRDDQGWASVGDAATQEHGILTVLGRGEAAVTIAGHTIPLHDVENALRTAPGVADVVCLGIPDPTWGERLVAVVEPLPGHDPRPGVRAAARTHLATHARAFRVLVSDLPRTPGGKVARHAVREALLETTPRLHPAPGPA